LPVYRGGPRRSRGGGGLCAEAHCRCFWDLHRPMRPHAASTWARSGAYSTQKTKRPRSMLNSKSLAALTAIATALLGAAALAQPGDERIPQFASIEFGWQTNLED